MIQRMIAIGSMILVTLMLLSHSNGWGGGGAMTARIAPRQEFRTIDEEEMARVLESHFRAAVGSGERRVEIRALQGFDPVAVPSGDLSFEVIAPEQAYRGGKILVSVRALAAGREVKRVRVAADLDIYGDVVVARTSLRKHQEVREEDLQVVKKNLTLLQGDVLTDLKQAVGRRTTLSVNGQEVLRKGMVEWPPLVRKGDRVMLIVDNSSFRVTSWGEVKEEGRRGERIKLVNLSSRKEVSGKIVDAGTVLVDF
jgi:flagellar basal body P-ring formation protein FlgA